MTRAVDTVMRVRAATIDDVGDVLTLFDEAVEWFKSFGNTGQWGTQPFSEQPRQIDRVASWLSTPGAWIAELPTVPIAGAIVLGSRHDYVPEAADVELYVSLLLGSRSPDARGAGRALLAFADHQAEAAGIHRLRVDCYNGGNGRLAQFYESCGYERTQTFLVGDWPGQLLERHLTAQSPVGSS